MGVTPYTKWGCHSVYKVGCHATLYEWISINPHSIPSGGVTPYTKWGCHFVYKVGVSRHSVRVDVNPHSIPSGGVTPYTKWGCHSTLYEWISIHILLLLFPFHATVTSSSVPPGVILSLAQPREPTHEMTQPIISLLFI